MYTVNVIGVDCTCYDTKHYENILNLGRNLLSHCQNDIIYFSLDIQCICMFVFSFVQNQVHAVQKGDFSETRSIGFLNTRSQVIDIVIITLQLTKME